MGEIAISQARENLAEVIESTQRSGEPIVLTRHGRPVAVVLEHAAFERLVAQHLRLPPTATGSTPAIRP